MIYLDNNATTALDPEVFEAMKPFLTALSGNPSSVHRYGQEAKAALTEATRVCARFFHVRPDEIVFTSGATEALNWLIRSIPAGSHVISSSLEHAAVVEPLKQSGCCVTYLDPKQGQGAITPAQVAEALRENTGAIILTAVNNETGIKTDLEAIAALAKSYEIPFIVDGVAWLGKEAICLPSSVAAACFSGHKIHGPLGVGLVVVRKGFKTKPLITGGGQQRGLRSGTENLPAIVGFAKALQLLTAQQPGQILELRERFENGLRKALPDMVILGEEQPRICNTSQIAFPGVDGETLLFTLDLAGVAVSHGAACSSGTLEASRVLLSMGIEPALARSSLRFSFSRFNTADEIDAAITIIHEAVNRLRQRIYASLKQI